MPALVVVPKFTWQAILTKLPARSELFAHGKCPNSCARPDGTRPKAATIHHVSLVIADPVSTQDDQSRSYLSIPSIAFGAKRSRRTVIAVVAHLQAVGLLDRIRQGGGLNVARGVSSVYSLTIPDPQLLKLAGIDPVALARMEEQLRQPAGQEAHYRWFDRA